MAAAVYFNPTIRLPICQQEQATNASNPLTAQASSKHPQITPKTRTKPPASSASDWPIAPSSSRQSLPKAHNEIRFAYLCLLIPMAFFIPETKKTFSMILDATFAILRVHLMLI